jgi:hypothetical protein
LIVIQLITGSLLPASSTRYNRESPFLAGTKAMPSFRVFRVFRVFRGYQPPENAGASQADWGKTSVQR